MADSIFCLNMHPVIEFTEDSLDRVLAFYEMHGVPLSYRPRFKYIPGPHPKRPDCVAMIREEFEVLGPLNDDISKIIDDVGLWNVLDLNISDAAIEEHKRLSKSRLKPRHWLTDYDEFRDPEVDIFLFRPYRLSDNWERDNTIAHEVWHLVERERGIITRNPMIMEGTATYAALYFDGSRLEFDLKSVVNNIEDFLQMRYVIGAYFVQTYVEKDGNPLKTMLYESVRNLIERELMTYIEPHMVRLLKGLYENESILKSMAENLKKTSNFPQHTGKLTEEMVIKSFRDEGAVIFASELQGENLKKMMDLFRKMGF